MRPFVRSPLRHRAHGACTAIACAAAWLAGCGSSAAGTAPGVEVDEPAEDAGTATTQPHTDAAAPHHCDTPPGFWTADVGGVLPASDAWDGLPENEWSEGMVHASDYLDCDGSRGIHALLVDESVVWCEACWLVAKDIAKRVPDTWDALGIRVVTVITENGDHTTPVLQDAIDWKKQYDLGATAVTYDDQGTLATPDGHSLPMPALWVVDPKTMRVVSASFGWSGDYSALEQFARDNAKPSQ